jgi:hypothetical protein
MGRNGCLMFCQITADEERRVSRLTIVMQHLCWLVRYLKRSDVFSNTPRIILHYYIYFFYKNVKNFRSLMWLNLHTNSSDPMYNSSCLAIVELGAKPLFTL